jgi:GTP-binding protein
LNALVGRRIARISATPGKTRAMTVYEIPRPRAMYFLDLPGYGYARVSKAERTAFAGLVRHILDRPRLVGVVWLLDARREPSAGDRAMQDLLAQRHIPVLVAVTKADRLPRTRRAAQATVLQRAVGVDEDQVILTSARTADGIVELREAIAALVA